MEFKERMKKACRVKNVILFCLVLLFLWWGSSAVVRYWSQHLTTDISYEYGETNLGIQFPLITLCQTNIYIENPAINECNDGSWDYESIFVSCIKENQTFKVKIAN